MAKNEDLLSSIRVNCPFVAPQLHSSGPVEITQVWESKKSFNLANLNEL